MIKFKGPLKQKFTISIKPIFIGFKIFALGDFIYIYNWECIRPGLAEGLKIIKTCISVSILNSKLSIVLNPI